MEPIKGKRIEDHLSKVNKIDHNCESLLGANQRARAREQAMECPGEIKPMAYDMKDWEIRHRYRKEFVLPGQANRRKSHDRIY